MSARPKYIPREMTARDWKALYLVMRLQEQIILHGASALKDFITAARTPEGT